MSKVIDNYFRNLVGEIEKILPNTEKKLSEDTWGKTKALKEDIEKAIFENFTQLKRALQEFYKQKKESDAKIKELKESLDELKKSKKIFDDIKIENIENKEFKITYSFVSPIAKKLFKLFDMGSGTLRVPTTRILWKKVKEYFKEGRVNE